MNQKHLIIIISPLKSMAVEGCNAVSGCGVTDSVREMTASPGNTFAFLFTYICLFPSSFAEPKVIYNIDEAHL